MSKQLTIVMPDNFIAENVKIRIEQTLNDERIKVVETSEIGENMANVLLEIAKFQKKLKDLT